MRLISAILLATALGLGACAPRPDAGPAAPLGAARTGSYLDLFGTERNAGPPAAAVTGPLPADRFDQRVLDPDIHPG